MRLQKEKSAATASHAKRQLENPLTEAQKEEKAAVEAERLRKIQRTADRNSERLRAMTERRSAAGAEGLAAEATRKSTRRKSHPLIVDEKAEEARADAERRCDELISGLHQLLKNQHLHPYEMLQVLNFY
jgi:hypothetical protein